MNYIYFPNQKLGHLTFVKLYNWDYKSESLKRLILNGITGKVWGDWDGKEIFLPLDLIFRCKYQIFLIFIYKCKPIVDIFILLLNNCNCKLGEE